MDDQNMTFRPSFVERTTISIFHLVNRVVPWFKLPSLIGAMNLAFMRVELRGYNLHDGYASASDKFNSLELPRMGCTGMRLGRNFPREHCQKPTEEQLWSPNPRLISEKFIARKEGGFIPAIILNLLAAAWIQFQTHDWFNHELDRENEPYDIPLPPGYSWQGKMMLLKTKPDDILDPSDMKCPGYKNINTAWWDGSQIYGSEEATRALRASHPDGKLELAENGTGAFILRDKDGNPRTGFNDNWWVSIEMLYTLFALEYNTLCDMFRKGSDNIAFFEAKHGKHQTITPVVDLTFKNAQKPLELGISFSDLFYSFGVNYPGAITNNNYPNFLHDLHTPDGLHRDMGTVDIVRDRERGVPRYCAFRRMLRIKAPKTFEELTGSNKELAAQLSEVYNGDIELVDALVGSYSEPVIPGFGFSEAAFRIFIAIASQRLKSDRFIAGQWNTEMYTKEGFYWVQHITMKDVLIRYFPELEDTLKNSKNTFAPWAMKPESKNYQGIETNAKKT
ncbi:unnamed protein product [Clonostachys rosea f. rosea IK726]|uniref:Uncharacterized protein n=1 Tax=Clonostachys rosea f. rosea IK726 TaxID=1349383 RepID=A0ACA9UKF2_BIOOC|nr:unnamed protein product [Clonostachys rosea f. rosea IK726]